MVGRIPLLDLIPTQVFEMCSKVVAKQIRDGKLAKHAGVFLAWFKALGFTFRPPQFWTCETLVTWANDDGDGDIFFWVRPSPTPRWTDEVAVLGLGRLI